MKDNYQQLIVGDAISTLIKNGFLANAETYNYDVALNSLKIGINGDYTVKSSEALYTNTVMQGMPCITVLVYNASEDFTV